VAIVVADPSCSILQRKPVPLALLVADNATKQIVGKLISKPPVSPRSAFAIYAALRTEVVHIDAGFS
jgi:hypothetical protein